MREARMKNLLYLDIKYFSGLRYMDDIFYHFFYDEMDGKSLQRAKRLYKHILKKCYPPEMKIKIEDSTEGSNFLSTTSSWNKSKISIRWLNKNFETMEKNKKQKIIRFVHAKSFSPKSTKDGAMYAQFLRVARNSDEENLSKSLEELTKEYELLAYRREEILQQRRKIETLYTKQKNI
jgi:hypothetical protein